MTSTRGVSSGPGSATALVLTAASSWLTPAGRAAASAGSSLTTARQGGPLLLLLVTHIFQELQSVRGNDYTDFNRRNFDCGRFKTIHEINSTSESDISIEVRSEEVKVYQYGNLTDFYCGATIVSDRQETECDTSHDTVLQVGGGRLALCRRLPR